MLSHGSSEIELLPPKASCSHDRAGLEEELCREVGPELSLHGAKATAVARRHDCDDILFVIEGTPLPLAVVHLTWSGQTESAPRSPATEFFTSWEDWATRRTIADHRETILRKRRPVCSSLRGA